MKRLILVFFSLFLATVSSRPVSAASFGVYASGDSSFSGNSFTIHLGLSGSAGSGGACGGICGLTANLSYDSSKISLSSASASQGFDFIQGSTLVLYKASAASDGTILTLTFNNVGLSDGESTTISFSNVVGSNGDEDISASGASKTVTYAPLKPEPKEEPAPKEGPTPSPEKSEPTPASRPANNSEGQSSTKPASNSAPSETNAEKAEESEESEEPAETSSNGKDKKEEKDDSDPRQNEASTKDSNPSEGKMGGGGLDTAIIISAISIIVVCSAITIWIIFKKKKTKQLVRTSSTRKR